MPPQLFTDVTQLDLDNPAYSIAQVRRYNPQRYEFEQLSSVVLYDPEAELAVGVRDVGSDEFWVRGHIPERPLFPGVLMVEAAAQLCSFYSGKVGETLELEGFFGFGGIEQARFRGMVQPGDRLVLLCKPKRLSPRRSLFATQGAVDGKLVFEADILGLRM